ncbi:MAG TPA: sugar ABC transporter ATP-binding protein [Bryobacteraceae bacterium]|nr:sugar ABC transporter ATP-binding protein [Bryobacteraceae bacterium]
MSLLELAGITKSFSGVRVLDHVDLNVRPGEIHALAGENGAGKSTLMNIISGVMAADGGQMLWEGVPVRLRRPRDAMDLGISFVHQELALVPQLSAAENIFLGRYPCVRGWISWREIHDRAGKLFAELGHPIDPSSPVADLSLAARQLVEIARALAFHARLIIMDEPTAPLTEQDAECLFRTIRTLRRRGVSIIYISHRLGEILRISDRVTIMRDGRRVLTEDTSRMSEGAMVRAMVGGELTERPDVRPASRTTATEAIRIEGPIDITIHHGEIVGLAGLAGAGRTKLLESIFGARRHYAGRIFVNGSAVRIRTPIDAIRHGIALVADDRKTKGLVLNASLRNNIALAGRRPVFIRAAQETAAAARLVGEMRIKCVGLNQAVQYLSGGNQQKAVLAKWLFAGSCVFLLDEPTRGIDVRSKAEIYDLVRALARGGAAVLMASSEHEELLALSDRILVMHRGRIAGALSRAEATEERIVHLATGGVN